MAEEPVYKTLTSEQKAFLQQLISKCDRRTYNHESIYGPPGTLPKRVHSLDLADFQEICKEVRAAQGYMGGSMPGWWEPNPPLPKEATKQKPKNEQDFVQALAIEVHGLGSCLMCDMSNLMTAER
ncbi:hypothetical protein LTR56_011684 [Elasticomyces elasticus]|nr:hypothetical protein LTR56_011684 [Elasticomyces elasticus]KAK3658529.1 hypothetical protein LTR22_008882 [Elasticomyces elasticus]